MTECDLYCQGTESLHHLRRPCTRDTEEFQETRQCEAGWRWFQFERAASVSWSASLSQASASRIVAVIQISLEDNQSCSQKSYKTERDVIYVNVCLYNVSKLHIWSSEANKARVESCVLVPSPCLPVLKGQRPTTHSRTLTLSIFHS